MSLPGMSSLGMSRRGLTVIELMVSMAVIGVLVGLLLPAVAQVREAARRTQCRANLQQIGMALHNYEAQYRVLPSCTTPQGLSWHVALLPNIEQSALYRQLDLQVQPVIDIPEPIQHVVLPVYLCPSDPAPAVSGVSDTLPGYAATNYLGNSGTGLLDGGVDGVFTHMKPYQPSVFPGDGPVSLAAISDGLTQTAAVSEVLHSVLNDGPQRLRTAFQTTRSFDFSTYQDFRRLCSEIPEDPAAYGWLGSAVAHGATWTRGSIGYSTYNHSLTPQLPSCFNQTHVVSGIFTAASGHAGLVNVLFLDGHVASNSTSVDAQVWREAGSRATLRSAN